MADLVRRIRARPLVWLGERTSASDVAPLAARFPAADIKARDFVVEPRAR